MRGPVVRHLPTRGAILPGAIWRQDLVPQKGLQALRILDRGERTGVPPIMRQVPIGIRRQPVCQLRRRKAVVARERQHAAGRFVIHDPRHDERHTGLPGQRLHLQYQPPGGKLGAAVARMFGEEPNQTPNPLFDWYYGLIDFEFWIRKYGGDDVVTWIKANVHPLDIVFRLAEDHGIVLLNGGGFDAPDWSVRVSFANLDDDVYDDIGRAVRAVARGYVMACRAAQAAATTAVHSPA